MTYIGALTLALICAPIFGLYASVALDLALQLSACLSIAVAISIAIPDIVAQLALEANLAIGIQVAITIGLPSVSVAVGLAISAQLVIVLGLVAVLKGVLSLGGASLQAFTYSGTGAGLGGDVGAAVAGGWPDGTPSTSNVTAILLGATSSGTVGAGSVASVNLLGGGKNYERGLCSVAVSAPPPGGLQATASPTVAAGVLTGIAVTFGGLGYSPKAPPSFTISDATAVLGATNASPIVLTVADTTDVTAVTVAGVEGPAGTGANGPWSAKILGPKTIALYEDGAFTVPSAGTGAYTGGGTVTGNGAGAAASAVMGGGAQAQLQGYFDGLVFGSGLVSAGSITLAAICAVAFQLFLDLLGNLQLQAKLLASASVNFTVVPPTIAGNATIVAAIGIRLKAALKFIPPSIQAKLSAAISGQAKIIASLVGRIGLQLGFATEELQVYSYSGPGSGFGPAVSAALAGGWGDGTPPTSFVNAVILAATTPAASAALTGFFPGAA